MSRFCVYLHKDADGIVRYVGSGTKDRATAYASGSRSKGWNLVFSENKPSVEILHDGLERKEALLLEIEAYNKYKDTIVNVRCPSLTSKVNDMEFDVFNEWFYIDQSSSSGLRWKKQPNHCKPCVGKVAGSLLTKEQGKQYWQIKLNYKVYKVHRIVYLLSHGYLNSELLVDHINGNGLDNSVQNLQLSNHLQNCFNAKRKTMSATGEQNVFEKSTFYKVAFYFNQKSYSTSFHFSDFQDKESAFKAAVFWRDSMKKKLKEETYNKESIVG